MFEDRIAVTDLKVGDTIAAMSELFDKLMEVLECK